MNNRNNKKIEINNNCMSCELSIACQFDFRIKMMIIKNLDLNHSLH